MGELTVVLKPNFEKGEKIDIVSMGLVLPAVITGRTARVNMETGVILYFYDFKHDHEILVGKNEPWSWSDVHEQNLRSMMWLAKNHYEKTGRRYGEYLKR